MKKKMHRLNAVHDVFVVKKQKKGKKVRETEGNKPIPKEVLCATFK